MSLCQRHRDVHFPANLIQLGDVDAPVHDCVTGRAEANEVADFLGDGLEVHHVVVRFFWDAALEAEHFPRFAGLFVFRSPCPMVCRQFDALDEHGALLIECWQSVLDPSAHSALENVIKAGSFFHGVVAVYLGAVGVMEAFFHNGYPPLALA